MDRQSNEVFFGHVTFFNSKQLEKEGRSYGFLEAKLDGQSFSLWFGTDGYRQLVATETQILPAVFHNLYRVPQAGDRLAFRLGDNHKGLIAARWCFAGEYEQVLAEHEQLKREAEQFEQELQDAIKARNERRAVERLEAEAEARARRYANPRTIEEAVELGWKIDHEKGSQVILHGKVNGKTVSKTMYRPRYAAKRQQRQRASA
jgi:hypothetical protein